MPAVHGTHPDRVSYVFLNQEDKRDWIGVKKGLNGNGNGSTTAHIPKYLTIFDVRKHGYRNVNLDTITYLAANGCKFLVVEW